MRSRLPWSRILAEGLVIVVSILLAFSIDAWWSEVQDQRRAQSAIAGVRDEMVGNGPEIDLVVANHRRLYDAGITVLEVAIGRSEPDSMFAEDASWVLSVEMRLDVATEALDRFLRSDQNGALYPQLRDRLARFRSSLDQVWQQEEMIRGIVRGELASALSERFDLLRIGTGASFGEFELSELGRSVAAGDAGSQSRYMLEVVRDPLIRNLVTARVGREYVAAERIQQLHQQYDSLLVDLQSLAAEPARQP